jgi:hypothetical protein
MSVAGTLKKTKLACSMDWALKASQNSTKKEGGKRKMGGGKPCGELDGLGTRSITEFVYDPTWALLCKKNKKKSSQKKEKRGITELYDPTWALL